MQATFFSMRAVLLMAFAALLSSMQSSGQTTAGLYSDTIEALHYEIRLSEVNIGAKTIQANTLIDMQCHVSGVTSLKLELVKLTVDSVQVDGTSIVGFTHSGNQLLIPLANPLVQGQLLNARVYYHGNPFVDPSGWGGFHFSGDYAFNLGVGFDAIPHNLGKAWFPCFDDFQDRALYDVYITVGNAYKAVSGGILQAVANNGNGTSTWHWQTQHSLPTYLISASIGKYALTPDTFAGMAQAVPITLYSRVMDSSKVSGTFVNLKNILSAYESAFGPYPFERVGYTATAQGAMEHAANISYPFSGWDGTTASEWWYAHELSHMWFGDAVTCASAEDMWLNEGWAVWCESYFREVLYGKKAYKDNMRGKLRNVLQKTHITDGGYYAVYGIPQTITYGSTVYDKGGQVAHSLRNYLGDSLFFGGVKAYLNQYKYNHADTYQLRDFLSTWTGIDLTNFFEAWVFSPGFTHFAIDSVSVQPVGGNFQVHVYVRQRTKAAPQLYNQNHIEIRCMSANWETYTDTLCFSGIRGDKIFTLPFAPITVMADPDEKISDATTDQINIFKVTGDFNYSESFAVVNATQVTDSALVRVTHHWVAADTLRQAIPGFRLSDTRYWTLEGVLPNSFKARCSFAYSRLVGFDNLLISSAKDSLVLMYRPDARQEWAGIPATKDGSWSQGYMVIDSLRQGDYCLGVWDRTHTDDADPAKNTGQLHLYPNPTNNNCHITINIPEAAQLIIRQMDGHLVYSKGFDQGTHQIDWQPAKAASGAFVVCLNNEKGMVLASQKLVLAH